MSDGKGFFVVLVKVKTKISPPWKADVLYPIHGWQKTMGVSMQEALDGQKLQYDTQLAMKNPVPDLTEAHFFFVFFMASHT